MKLLGVNAVDHPGGAEVGLLRLASRLRERGWEVTLTSPDDGPISEAGYPWLRLDVGGLATARARGRSPRGRGRCGWPSASTSST